MTFNFMVFLWASILTLKSGYRDRLANLRP